MYPDLDRNPCVFVDLLLKKSSPSEVIRRNPSYVEVRLELSKGRVTKAKMNGKPVANDRLSYFKDPIMGLE